MNAQNKPTVEQGPPSSEVQQLLETTYLGHSGQEPDLDEPAVVLNKYIEQNAHGYLEELARKEDQAELDGQIAAWETLVQQYPNSRHARVAIGRLYRIKAVAAREQKYMQQAAEAYMRATEIGVVHGRIRHTRELSEVLVELQDTMLIDQAFKKLLTQPKNQDPKESYSALLGYADALAKLDDTRAWGLFEEALNLAPDGNIEALNHYLEHLVNKQQAQKALAVLNQRTTREQRIQSGVQVHLHQRVLKDGGLDTASADEEVAETKRRLTTEVLNGYSPSTPSTTEAVTREIKAVVNTDGRVFPSALFLAQTNTAIWDSQMYSSDSAISPAALFSGQATKISAFRLPNSTQGNSRGGVAVIGNSNTIYYRYYNGTTWGSWTQIPGASGTDVTAVGRPNGEIHIFIVKTDGTVSQNRTATQSLPSANPGPWVGWVNHVCCASKVAAAALLDGTIYLAAQANTAALGYAIYWISTTNGVSYPTPWSPLGSLPGVCPSCLANDLTVLAYKPNVNGASTVAIAAVGPDQCTVYQKHKALPPSTQWDPSWFPFSTSPCYKSVSSFTTLRKLSSTTFTEEGAFLLFTGKFDTQLYTIRHNGTAWLSAIPQGINLWAFAAGADFVNRPGQPPFVHTIYSDDCRVQNQTCYPDPNNPPLCFRAQTINLAEVLYNEAPNETYGARALVGWTVRDRAYQSLSCDSYPGAQGGALTTTCRQTVPCNDPLFCDSSKRYCCAIHGGTTTSGASHFQFNDGHVAFSTLYTGGYLQMAVNILNGKIPDPSTGFVPSGVSGCTSTTACDSTLICSSGANTTAADPSGPHEYRGGDSTPYTPTISSCKRLIGYTNCANGSPNNYFWGRKP